MDKVKHTGGCHCGAVRFDVWAPKVLDVVKCKLVPINVFVIKCLACTLFSLAAAVYARRSKTHILLCQTRTSNC